MYAKGVEGTGKGSTRSENKGEYESKHKPELEAAGIDLYNRLAWFVGRAEEKDSGAPYVIAFSETGNDSAEGTERWDATLKGAEGFVVAKHVIIATGGRPWMPSPREVPGAEQYALTSDDIFSSGGE